MSNPFYYLLGLFIAFSYPTGAEPLFFARHRHVAPVAFLAAVVLYVALAQGVHRLMIARGWEGRIGLARAFLRVMGLVLFAVLVYVFHLPLWIWNLGLEENALAGGLALLAPLMIFYAGLAAVVARTEPQLRGGDATPADYLRFGLRSFLGLSFAPIVFILGIDFAFQRSAVLRKASFVYPAVSWIVVMGSSVVLLMVLPVLLRLAFGARRLPAGPMRERLETFCRTVGFRHGGLFRIKTGGLRWATAFIAGVSLPWRYVFFTDSLLEGMTPEELECVLAHEISHSQRRHILFYLLLTLGFAATSAVLQELMGEASAGPLLILGVLLALSALFWVVIFGFISRRFESEADLAAARLVSPERGPYGGAPAMASALGTVAHLNRASVTAWSWRHFNILTRIQILAAAEADPSVGEAFEGGCRRMRGGALTFVLMAGAAAFFLVSKQSDQAAPRLRTWEAYEQVDRGIALQRAGRWSEAASELRAGIEAGAEDPSYWLRLAECQRLLGRTVEARASEGRARKGGPIDPRDRLKLLP